MIGRTVDSLLKISYRTILSQGGHRPRVNPILTGTGCLRSPRSKIFVNFLVSCPRSNLKKSSAAQGAARRCSYRPATQIPSEPIGRPHNVNKSTLQAQTM